MQSELVSQPDVDPMTLGQIELLLSVADLSKTESALVPLAAMTGRIANMLLRAEAISLSRHMESETLDTMDALGGPPGANRPPVDAIAMMNTPLQRAGQAEEIAAGIVFLASDESAFITGSELVIDGGWTA